MGIFTEMNELHSAQVAYETEPDEPVDSEQDCGAMEPDIWYTVTPEEIREHATLYGKAAAASLLLLTPPDRFEGDYDAMMDEMAGNS